MRTAVQSRSVIANQAVSRLRPLTIWMVAEDALEAKAKAFGGTPRGLVERVALPLQPAITEIVEGVAREQTRAPSSTAH